MVQIGSAGAHSVAAPTQRGMWVGIARSAAAKVAVLGVSALLGIIVTRLVIENYGSAAFAQYGLLVGLGALLPFTDLGMSAAVMNAVAASPEPATDETVVRTLLTAIRVLIASAAVLGAIALVVTQLGLWPSLLGAGLSTRTGPLAALGCVLLIALAMPLGVGQRMLAGLGKNHLSIVIGGMQTPILLGLLCAFLWWRVPVGGVVAVLAYAVTFLLAGLSVVVAARLASPSVMEALRRVPWVRSRRGTPVFQVAWPALVQMIALPVAMQSDRIVLSHRAGVGVLAQYNLASQMFTPIWAVVSAAGVTLWPVYARNRARGGSDSPVPLAWFFAGGSAVMALGVAWLSPVLTRLASGGRVSLDWTLVVSFVLLMIFQGAKYPLGVFLTDIPGLRFQALMVAIMLPVNLGLSWYLAGVMGVAGPVLGSVVGVAVFQVLANYLFVARRLRRTLLPTAGE
jgi:O-antigen/teichoic acid export membrane protein